MKSRKLKLLGTKNNKQKQKNNKIVNYIKIMELEKEIYYLIMNKEELITQ